MDFSTPETLDMHPQQGNFHAPPYFQQHNQAQQIRQQQHYLQIRDEQQRHMQHQQQIRQQQILRQEQIRQQQPQTFHQSSFRSILPQFQQQTAGWQRVSPPVVRLAPRFQPQEQRPLVVLQKRMPNWTFHNARPPAPQPPPLLQPIILQNEISVPPLVPLSCELSPLSEENFNQVPICNDDFNDFDVTDLLRLSFDDESDKSNRKRKGNTIMYGSHTIKRRRTKAEITAEKNMLLMRKCKDLSVDCERLQIPSHVRIFGSKILRGNLPNVPNMKLTPKNIDFNRVRNIGYLVTKKGVCFSCLTKDCKFKSYDQDKFREHLGKFHGIEGCGTSEGYCEICKKNCCGFNVIDEFIHINKCHVKSVDDHPMHQILYSHINVNKQMEKTLKDKSRCSSLLDELDSELIYDFLLEDEKAETAVLTNDFDDDDYHPSSSEDEAESDLISEGVPEINLEDLSEESEAKMTSSEDEEEEETEIENISQSDSDREHRKKKTECRITDSNEDDIPNYMLERIKQSSSIKCDENNEAKIYNESFTKVIEELINEEVPELTKKQKKRKKKKKKQKSQNFACKSTSKCDSPLKEFAVISPKALAPCRVVLTRCDLNKIERTERQPKESLKMVIKRTDKDKQIAVPDIPTPPSSEDSRDSLSTPPLNKNIERTNETTKLTRILDESDGSVQLSQDKVNEEFSKEVYEEKSSTPKSDEINEEIDKEHDIETDLIYNTLEINQNDKDTESKNQITKKDAPKIIIESVEILNGNCEEDSTVIESENVPLDDTKDLHEDIEEISENVELKSEPKAASNIDKAKGFVNSIRNYFSPQKSAENNFTTETQSSNNDNSSNESENVSKIYPWIDSKISNEIFKTKKCLTEMESEFYQFSTYKCMNEICSFFTTDFQKFKIHSNTHKDEHNFCSFCLYDGNNSEKLCEHIELLHKHDRYQCNLCMYRSCEKVYVEWHQEKFHQDLKGKILKSPIQALMKSVRKKIQDKLENENREKFVKPYTCKSEFIKIN